MTAEQAEIVYILRVGANFAKLQNVLPFSGGSAT
jgi:hypothetical protein